MALGHAFHPTVLRAYDIRGIVGETIDEADAKALGLAFGTVVRREGGDDIAVGYDGRLTSPRLEAALVEGLAATGLVVRRIGLGPTPMLSFAVKHFGCAAGVQVTGSHNPKDHNGFKLTLRGRPFYGDDIVALGRRAAAGDYDDGKGRIEGLDARGAYLDALAAVAWPRPLDIAWDAGNGAAGAVLPDLLKRVPGKQVGLNLTVDGTFPAHHPDPTVPENLAQLIAAVKYERLDLGIGFDGDGDRLGVVDGLGRILWGDQILALLARNVLAERPGATIVADVKTGQGFFDEIARLGGKALMWKTGHSPIKGKMAEIGAPLAGEMSAHIFFADRWGGFDDAIYAALRLIEVVGESGKSLAQLHDELPRYVNTPEIRFDCAEERKFAVVEEVKARVLATGAEANTLDGVRVKTREGWWLLRASNTQAVLVARCEAKDQAGLDRLKAALASELAKSGVKAPKL
ncbi:MAG: phosphomannomutase/phosphoglucomutase [Alphaproteobacteria bacterium]|nr:phosphomannomutase/phosphoglucomutase [Alphaproteobacteria bacterium]